MGQGGRDGRFIRDVSIETNRSDRFERKWNGFAFGGSEAPSDSFEAGSRCYPRFFISFALIIRLALLARLDKQERADEMEAMTEEGGGQVGGREFQIPGSTSECIDRA